MFYFAHPDFLVLLLLLPVLPVVFGIVRFRRKAILDKFGERKLVRALMPDWSASRGWWKIIMFTFGLGCVILALARPQMGAKLKEHETRGAEIMICLDVSNSMLAQDYTPSRLERAKLAISRLADKLAGDRIGLVVFAGNSFVQLPITTDYVSAKMFLNSINTNSVPVQGTAIGDAILTAAKGFSPQSEKSRAIIVITDGENHEDDAEAAAAEAASVGVKVYTIGVGSAQGQPIMIDGSLLKDKEGNIVVTKLDEESLLAIAKAGNGAYVQASNEEFGLNPIIDDIRRMEEEELGSLVFEEYSEQHMYFWGAALFFFLIEALIGERRWKKKLFE